MINIKKEEREMAKKLGIEIYEHPTKEFQIPNRNAYEITEDNIVPFYPVNDGFPTKAFEFYKKSHFILSNERNYSEITNLDDLLIQITRVYKKALENKIILDPYAFQLKLDGPIRNNYVGSAKLTLSRYSILNTKLREEQALNEFYFRMNQYLDHFIGWNFGASVNRNETLRNELDELNEALIEKKIRRYAGAGFSVVGTLYTPIRGLQHVHFPTSIEEEYQLSKR